MTLNDAKVYYSFDSSTVSGTSVTDLSGNSHTGTLRNGASIVSTGKINGAVFVDGTDNMDVQVDGGITLYNLIGTRSYFSFIAWAYFDSSGAYDCCKTIVGEYKTATLIIDSTSGYTEVFMLGSNGTSYTAKDSNPIGTDNFVHFAATYDHSTMKLYRNGTLVASTSVNVDYSSSTQDGVYVGNDPHYGNREWIGKLDEVGVYDRALSATEVSDSYNSGNGYNPYAPSGWSKTIIGVSSSSKINGISASNISKVNGV